MTDNRVAGAFNDEALATMFARGAAARAAELVRLYDAELDARLGAEDPEDPMEMVFDRMLASAEAQKAAWEKQLAYELDRAVEACDIIVASIEAARGGQQS